MFAHAWLCFEARAERRRLTPIPDDWATCADGRLADYCRDAKPVNRR